MDPEDTVVLYDTENKIRKVEELSIWFG